MKATKTDARYQDYPKGIQQCSGCTMFRKPHGCTAVQGRISSSGWCRFYEVKK